MGKFHQIQFPGETPEYRKSRDDLLQAEIDLRKQIETVADMRRNLPPGGKLKENYNFEEYRTDSSGSTSIHQTPFPELFHPGKNTLIIYSFMYSDKPCPSCTSILDSLDGTTPHVIDRINFVVVAKAPIQALREWGQKRGWNSLRLLSSAGNTYNSDYGAETPTGSQIPAINVFTQNGEAIHHTYNGELLYAPSEEGQNPRHVDLLWPLWNLFDLTPEGRGTDWFPRFSYGS